MSSKESIYNFANLNNKLGFNVLTFNELDLFVTIL